MRRSVGKFSSGLLIAFLTFAAFGCSDAPSISDDEAIRAISECVKTTGSGAERFLLKSPITIVNKSKLNGDKGWLVEAKFSFSYKMVDGSETKQLTRSMMFTLSRHRKGLIHSEWKAVLGTP